MKFFKSYTFDWWQVGIFKLALLLIGIIIGSFFYSFFGDYIYFLAVVAVIFSAYIVYISFKK